MSLILEALRKSEAERHRGLPPRLDSPMLRPTRRRNRLAPGLALLVLGAPAAGWFVYRGMAPDFAESQVDTSLAALLPPVGSSAGNPAIVPAATLAANDPASSSAGALDAPAAVSAVSVSSAPAVPVQVASSGPELALGSNGTALIGGAFAASQDLPPPERLRPHTPSANTEASSADAAPAASEPAPAQKTVQATAPVAQPPAPPAAQTPSPVAPQPAPVAAAAPVQVATAAVPPPVAPPVASAPIAPAPAAPEVPLIYDLSYEIRREIPKLALNMHVYSGDRDARFIVLNGKRLREGATIADSEVQLVEIRRAGAVLAFRGSTFLLPRQGM